MYIANHYVQVEGHVYSKGEAIPPIPAENCEWLLESGAITFIEDVDTEAVEEFEEPEIDIMDGIVMDESPKKSPGRKKS